VFPFFLTQLGYMINVIHNFRSALRRDQHLLRRRSSLAHRTKVVERRRRLLLKITAFNKKADQFLGDLDLDELPSTNNALGDDDTDEEGMGSEDDDAMSNEDENGNSDDPGSDVPDSDDDDEPVEWAENLLLVMPSTLGADHCLGLGLRILMEQEIQLRKGQANDALEELRTALAEKSLLYRTKIRGRPPQKTVTRSWTAVKRTDGKIRKHVKTYNLARTALLNMDANLGEFQAIVKEDLRMSGDVMEENRFGQRRDTLAWFWRMGPARDDTEGSWMDECEYHLIDVYLN
jgi:hypothetical protein